VEAIKASHENLRLAGRKAQRSLGSGLLNVAYVAACLRDDFHYERSMFINTKPKWEPLFEADANMLTLIGDGVIKLNQAIPGYLTAEVIRDLTGIKGNMEATPKVADDTLSVGVSTSEISSILSKYQNGILSKDNASLLISSTGLSKQEADRMIDSTVVKGDVNE